MIFEIVVTEKGIRRLAQRRKACQVRKIRKLIFFAPLASWRENLS